MTRPGLKPLPQYAHVPLLALISLCLMMQSLSTDMYIASLPSLSEVFDVSTATVQLTLSVFVFGFGSAQLMVGPLSDRFGRRPVLLGGLALYLCMSLLCTFSPSIEVLIAARFFQAIGCSCAFIIARAIIRDAYAPEHGMQVMVRASSWLSFTPILGPVIGAYLQVWVGWPGSFAAHSVISLCLLISIFFFLPETNQHKNPQATNIRGLLLSYKEVLGSRLFWTYASVGALSYAGIFTFISGASIVLIRILHMPVTWFGYSFSFATTGYLLGTLVCRRLLHRIGSSRALRFSSLASCIGGITFLTLVLLGYWHWSVVLGIMFMTTFVHGINSPLSQAGSVTPFAERAGTAAGLSGALYMIAAFIIGTIVGCTYNGTMYPIAIIACTNGLLSFICVRSFAEFRKKSTPPEQS